MGLQMSNWLDRSSLQRQTGKNRMRGKLRKWKMYHNPWRRNLPVLERIQWKRVYDSRSMRGLQLRTWQMSNRKKKQTSLQMSEKLFWGTLRTPREQLQAEETFWKLYLLRKQ